MSRPLLYLNRLLGLFFVPCLLLVCFGCEDDPLDPSTPEDSSKDIKSILIVPDIQNYTNNEKRFFYLDSISDYYIRNISSYVACFQLGDLTNNNQVNQYEAAYNHFFSKFPEGKEAYFCLGNHDYGKDGLSDVRQSNIPDYMSPKSDSVMEGSVYENYVRYLDISEKRYAVMDLEFCPRNDTIEWANGVVSSQPDTPFIILTHVFTNMYGQVHDETDPNVYHNGSQKRYTMDGDYHNDSMEIFNKLIKNNSNIMMVVCGHTLLLDFIGVTSLKNSFGKDVYIVTVNYQHFSEGGSGMVGVLDFFEESYRIRSFSTITKSFGDIDISFGRELEW